MHEENKKKNLSAFESNIIMGFFDKDDNDDSDHSLKSLISLSNDMVHDLASKSVGLWSIFEDDDMFAVLFSFDTFTKGGPFQNSTGLTAYPVPSAKLYKQCEVKNGLSGWDQRGIWRCLFPRALIPAEVEGVSREDVETGAFEEKFFPNFNDYLNWRGTMEDNVKLERAKAAEKRRQEWKQFGETELAKWGDMRGSSYSYSSNPQGMKTSKSQEWFEDGSSRIKESKKWIDENGQEQFSETVKDVPSDGKSGWFWNEK